MARPIAEASATTDEALEILATALDDAPGDTLRCRSALEHITEKRQQTIRLLVVLLRIEIGGGEAELLFHAIAALLDRELELAESIADHVKSGCLLALSGILSEQVGDVLETYRPWFEFDEPVEREHGGQTWARLTGRRTEG